MLIGQNSLNISQKKNVLLNIEFIKRKIENNVPKPSITTINN